MPFYEVIHSPEAETHYVTTLAVGPASQPALLQMDLPLVYLFVELLLGGREAHHSNGSRPKSRVHRPQRCRSHLPRFQHRALLA